MENRTSIQDIAKAANVSIATVSRVFNNSNKVRSETANKVLEVAKKMNYRPNRVARRMRVKNSDSLILGLIVTDLGNPFFSDLSRGVEDIAYKNKQALLVCNTDEDPEKEKFYIDSMLSERVSGIIIAPTTGNYDYLRSLKEQNYPIVCVDRYPSDLNIDTVTINNKKGAYEATKRLIELGHKRIGIINGIRNLSTTAGRYNGYKKAIKEAGIQLSKDLVVFENYKESGGREAIQHFLSLDSPPTAVFCTNNLMTLGCYEELHKRRINIPEDMAIIGFDDMPWAVALDPPLTAIKQPSYELGVNAVELLLKRLRKTNGNTMHMVLNPELIIRDSG